MMELSDDVYIQCSACGKIFKVFKSDIDFDYNTNDHGEYGMGAEYEYYCNSIVQCDNCGNTIQFRIVGYEYPLGCHAGEGDPFISGGEFVNLPNMIIVYEKEDFDSSVAYSIIPEIERIIIELDVCPNLIYEIQPRQFEELIEKLLIDQGYETKLTQKTRDGGKDIIATKIILGSPVVLYIECKRYGEKNSVDVGIVRSLYGVQTSDKVNKSILFTTGKVTSDAKKFVKAQGNLMSIVTAEEIKQMINQSANEYRKKYNL